MKTGTMVAILSVVVIVVVVGFIAFKPKSTQAPAPSQEPEFEDVTEGTGTSNLGQFIQEQPQETPPASNGDEEAVEESGDSAAGASELVEDVTVTIEIDELGFHPAEVTITAGTTVLFVNNGQAKHWPASDVHPTHEILPEFDANKGLETGETYSYTFNDVGEWSMHDHLNPRLVGTITVQ